MRERISKQSLECDPDNKYEVILFSMDTVWVRVT